MWFSRIIRDFFHELFAILHIMCDFRELFVISTNFWLFFHTLCAILHIIRDFHKFLTIFSHIMCNFTHYSWFSRIFRDFRELCISVRHCCDFWAISAYFFLPCLLFQQEQPEMDSTHIFHKKQVSKQHTYKVVENSLKVKTWTNNMHRTKWK